MKSKILTVLLMLFPFMQLTAYINEEDGESVDQFLLTIGSSGYMLWKAIDLAHEHGFRYAKILSAEYTMGNQSGSFVCHLEDDDQGDLLHFEDEICKMTISCFHFMPTDTDYMDTEEYQDIFELFDFTNIHDDDENDDGSDDDDDDEDEWY